MEELALLDSPDFSFDPATRPYLAGVRPFRKVSCRLEADRNVIPGKLVVHNYGHGGAGITMSWGCAEIVREIVTRHGTAGGVAVLGAAIMGTCFPVPTASSWEEQRITSTMLPQWMPNASTWSTI